VVFSRRLASLPLSWLTAKREESSVAKAAAGGGFTVESHSIADGALRLGQGQAEGESLSFSLVNI